MIDPKARKNLHKTKGVQSVGEGFKWVADTRTDHVGINVGVEKKLPKYQLDKRDIVPETIDGIATDVVETGKFYAQIPVIKPLAFDQRYRPCPGGVSGGHPKVTCGTVNFCWRNGELYMISNNHVLANSNNALIGDPAYAPGVYDGGKASDTLANLTEFCFLKFNTEQPSNCSISKVIEWLMNFYLGLTNRQTRVRFYAQEDNVNYIDAAIAKVINPLDVKDELITIGKIAGINLAQLGMEIQKDGRTTEYTKDKVLQENVSVIVGYGDGLEAYFENQYMAGAMSDGGDSGSLILDMNKNVVGLLFAGSTSNTIFNPIQPVIETFGISFGIGIQSMPIPNPEPIPTGEETEMP